VGEPFLYLVCAWEQQVHTGKDLAVKCIQGLPKQFGGTCFAVCRDLPKTARVDIQMSELAEGLGIS